jgi:hypothetical protein
MSEPVVMNVSDQTFFKNSRLKRMASDLLKFEAFLKGLEFCIDYGQKLGLQLKMIL